MPVIKSRSGELGDGEKSLLRTSNGMTSDEELEHDSEWVISYKKNGTLQAVEENGRKPSTISTRRQRNGPAHEFLLEDGSLDQQADAGPQINRKMFWLIVFGVAVGVSAVVCIVIFYFRSSYVPANHIIVIDAGASHTKLHVFHYRGDKLNGTGVIEEIFFSHCNGTLSENHLELRESWIPCLQSAKAKVPEDRWDKTEVYVGATAGTRQLERASKGSSAFLLNQLRNLLWGVFKLPANQTHVMILNGTEEGALAWMTVNFLKNRLLPQNSSLPAEEDDGTYGIMDLGGGSTQITFRTDPIDANINVTLYGTTHHLRSESLKCRGKSEALRLLKAQLVVEWMNSGATALLVFPCFPLGSWTTETDSSLFGSECTSRLRTQIRNPRASYAFSGTGNTTECVRLVRDMFRNECRKEPSAPNCGIKERVKGNSQPFMGFAGLYFVMDYFNLTDDHNQTSTTLEKFRETYDKQCTTRWSQMNEAVNPFVKNYCFDGAYIDVLLTENYGISEEAFSRIEFRKSVDGVHTGWAVGLALNSTNSVPAEANAQSMSRLFFLIFLVIFAVFLILAISFLCRGVRRSCRESSI